jgi:hypothetical protein
MLASALTGHLVNRSSARATAATFTGCQLRLSTSAGRCSIFATMIHSFLCFEG